jgi:hypothetical protein
MRETAALRKLVEPDPVGRRPLMELTLNAMVDRMTVVIVLAETEEIRACWILVVAALRYVVEPVKAAPTG